MLLAIDIGNTRIKCAVIERGSFLCVEIFTTEEAFLALKNIFEKFPKITHTIFSSVGFLNQNCLKLIKEKSFLISVSHETPMPFLNKYKTPKTLGVDRMVLTAGASLLYPKSNCLIIDAGTCITYDYLNDQNQYLGGAISPGIKLRYHSLHNYTAKLPLLEKKSPESFIGNETSEAIHSGVINGIVNEIEGFIVQYSKKNTHLTVILTGGDADFLAKRLKSTIFANSNFLLKSLDLLFTYLHSRND